MAETTTAAEDILLIASTPEATESVVATAPAAEDPTPTALDNALTLGIWAVLALAVIIMVIRKAVSKSKVTEAPVAEEAPEEPKAEGPAAPGAAGEVKLHGVEPKTAAMLMAIVADKMGKPINELRFISIKEVE